MKIQSILCTIGLLSACTAADVTMDFDTDGDGLMDSMEAEYGTDPLNVDSDLDNHSDAVEIEQGTDPLDPNDHPYTGGWAIDSACKDSVASTGNEVGDIAEGFEIVDQFGENVDLYDFCNRTILIASGAFW
jgi:hypothetical protein